jgi:Domain of unknown function (DUF4258)
VSETFQIIKALVQAGKFRISQHGDEEMREDGISLTALLGSVENATVIEDYPDAWKGPTVLVLQEFDGTRFHAIWGLSKVSPDIASLVTAYVPDPKKWNSDFRTRVIP